MDDTGLISIRSAHDVDETAARLLAAIDKAGLLIFADIDHGRNAAEVGMDLRPTRLILFGHAKGGTPLMQVRQAAGIDLPLKLLIWQDEYGATWVSYNDPRWIVTRHGLGLAGEASADAMAAGIAGLVAAATA
jgi:uncharacterized protein (DUF302 family)